MRVLLSSSFADSAGENRHPLALLPESSLEPQILSGSGGSAPASIPNDEECLAIWDRYGMFENVRRHSLVVARIATRLASWARGRGLPVDVEAVRASAMLHDVAKTYCLLHGGSHATLGATWAVTETRSRPVAQGVLLHVQWPWAVPADDARRLCSLPFLIIYADKRSMHDRCVPLAERHEDLLARYGRTERARRAVADAHAQVSAVERALEAHLGMSLRDQDLSAD